MKVNGQNWSGTYFNQSMKLISQKVKEFKEVSNQSLTTIVHLVSYFYEVTIEINTQVKKITWLDTLNKFTWSFFNSQGILNSSWSSGLLLARVFSYCNFRDYVIKWKIILRCLFYSLGNEYFSRGRDLKKFLIRWYFSPVWLFLL